MDKAKLYVTKEKLLIEIRHQGKGSTSSYSTNTRTDKKDINAVVLPNIFTHDLNVDTIRASIHIFGTSC